MWVKITTNSKSHNGKVDIKQSRLSEQSVRNEIDGLDEFRISWNRNAKTITAYKKTSRLFRGSGGCAFLMHRYVCEEQPSSDMLLWILSKKNAW